MDGSHNPRPTEMVKAREFIEYVVRPLYDAAVANASHAKGAWIAPPIETMEALRARTVERDAAIAKAVTATAACYEARAERDAAVARVEAAELDAHRLAYALHGVLAEPSSLTWREAARDALFSHDHSPPHDTETTTGDSWKR